MDPELLCLKWNNHNTTFIHTVSNLRNKALFTDATIACDGKLYQVHRLVLSSCSEYFSSIFEDISCPNPVIILKDISCKNLGFLLDYMYLGEVNVQQEDIDELIVSAECLKIRGLAAPDDVGDWGKQKHYSGDTSFSPEPPRKRKHLEKDDSPDSPASSNCNIEPSEFVQSTIKLEPPDKMIDNDIASLIRAQILPLESGQMNSNFDFNIDIKEEDFESGSVALSEWMEKHNSAGTSGLQNNNTNMKSYTHLLNELNSPKKQYKTEEQTLILRQWLEHLARVGGCNKLTCPLCGKVCSRSDKLKLHLRIHTGERPYCCQYCQHRSRTSDDLKRHIRTHTGERPYQCPFCVYRASDPSTIRSHKKYRHPQLFKASLPTVSVKSVQDKIT